MLISTILSSSQSYSLPHLEHRRHLVVCIFVIFNPFWDNSDIKISHDVKLDPELFYFFINTCQIFLIVMRKRERSMEGMEGGRERAGPTLRANLVGEVSLLWALTMSRGTTRSK